MNITEVHSIDFPPDSIFVIGGGYVVHKNRSGKTRYKSSSYRDKDDKGFMSASKGRVIAAFHLYQAYPNVVVVTNNVTRNAPPGVPSNAQIAASELARMGVPLSRIIKQECAMSTIAELTEAIKIIWSHGWFRTVIVSSEYHIARIKKMLGRLDNLVVERDEEFQVAWNYFQSSSGSLYLLDAESILVRRSSHYQTLIAKAKATHVYNERVCAEKKGLFQLEAGRYG